MATDSINNNYTLQKGQTLWQLGKSLGIKDSELNIWCQQVEAKNHITDPTKIKANQTIILEGLTVEKNTQVQQNESNNDAVPQNDATQPIKNNGTNNKQTAQQTDYIVQNGETPEAIVKKMYLASGNELDVNSAEFKEAVADFIDVNKDQIKNFGGHNGFMVGSTVKLPGEYDTTKMGMKSREEAISSYTNIIKAQEDKKAAKTKELADARKTAADLAEKAKASKAALDKTTAELAKLRKGDGHISAVEKLSCVGKGIWNFVKKPFTDEKGKFNLKKTIKSVAIAVGTAVAVTAAVAVVIASGGTAGAVIIPLIAAGVAMGGKKVIENGIKASKATTNDEAREAWTGMGEGVAEIGFSVAGARTGLKAGGIPTRVNVAGKNGILVAKEMNVFRATAKCIAETPKALKTTLIAFKNAPKNMPAIKTNLISTAKSIPQSLSSAKSSLKNSTLTGLKTTKKLIVKTPEALKASYTAIKNAPKKAYKASVEFIAKTPEYAKASYTAIKNAPKNVSKTIFNRKKSTAGEIKPKTESNADKTLYTQYDSELQYEANLKNKSTEAKTKTNTTDDEIFYTAYDSEQAFEASLNAKTTKSETKNATADGTMYTQYDSELAYETDIKTKTTKADEKTKPTEAKTKTDASAAEIQYTTYEPEYTEATNSKTTDKRKFTKMTLIPTLNINNTIKTKYKKAS